MKIKFLIRDLKVEGVQVVTLRMAKLLVDHGHDVEVVTLFEDIQLPLDGTVPIYTLAIQKSDNSKEKNKLINQAFLNWYHSSPSFDFLIASHSETIKLISKFNDPRLISYIHNSDEYSYLSRNIFKQYKYRFKLKRKLKNKHVFCVSDRINQFVKKCCGEQNLRSIHTIYNPFDFDSIQKKSKESILEPCPDNYIIFVGRIEKQKRLDRLVNAFSLLNNSNMQLMILGEGDLKADIQRQVNKLGLQKQVFFHDFVENPYPWIRKARLLALTSDFEGLPTVLIEALSIGTPVVSVDCPSGPSEILTGELSKYLINSYDEQVIAHKIQQVLEDSKEQISESGYLPFSNQQVYQRLLSTFNSL
ncbi:glycosyltransferase [Vibrio algivorus]|uniref:Glycosyl transferase n=1 Tax=Vibrio algivorus TaxID=1667024 RepID=A0ABQ6EJL2_9VIBR|nr:glycosyltransferase [Vibrio algivorus]GLT13161.1 glycosyl transferase [Vibrio algivorus]